LTAVLVFICALTWTSAVGWLWANESRFVFRAYRSRIILPVSYPGLTSLQTADGVRIDGVSLMPDDPSDYWILFCPPAAGTIHGRLQTQLDALRELGYNVFAFDYRGFGRNPGNPTEDGVYEDALAAYRHLTEERRVPASRVILAGRSLGSAVAVELSTRVQSAGLLLLSAIDSVPSTGGRLYPWAPVGLLASYHFDSAAKAARVRGPVLMVQATNDRLVPIAAARALFGGFPEPKLMIETTGGHNRAGFNDGTPLGEALARFWPRAPVRDGEGDSE
jgi:pimeloyl-ACP methyl ester carboxylesterase